MVFFSLLLLFAPAAGQATASDTLRLDEQTRWIDLVKSGKVMHTLEELTPAQAWQQITQQLPNN